MSDDQSDLNDRLDRVSDTLLERLLRIDGRLDTINDKLSALAATATVHQATLDEHMRRTELLEKSVAAVQERIRPLEKSEVRWALAAKVVAFVAATVGAVAGLIKLLG